MSISKFRGILYMTARILGDIQAVTHKKDPAKAVAKRLGRRLTGKVTGRAMGKLFPPTRRKWK